MILKKQKGINALTNIKTWKSETQDTTISIDNDKCGGAGECVAVCPSLPKVYDIEDNKATAPNIDNCIQCCACVHVCPTEAITHSSC
jgi:NAD-dependent dihydropyrimidine dehydrogenase PreA subunit